jgi:hypothetical protein
MIRVLKRRLSQFSVVISERFHLSPTPLFLLLPFLTRVSKCQKAFGFLFLSHQFFSNFEMF